MTVSFAQRGAMVSLMRRWRAYFAPVDRASGTPAIFDPARDGAFLLDSPPSPWLDLGWIEGLQRTPQTEFVPMNTGRKGAALKQARARLAARVEFVFREWGKPQMALSSGSQHMNLLTEQAGAPAQPSGGIAAANIAVLAGSSATEIVVGAGVADAFAPGDLIAVDVDYQQQTGFVGTGIAGAYVKDAADVQRDPHYIRRVTWNVVRVAAKTATSLRLAQPLPGGAPSNGASLQRVIGFVDREGGSFFQEWSALFVADSETGARMLFHYPRLQPSAPAAEGMVRVADEFDSLTLRADFLALPVTDANDGEQVLCYRSFLPAANAAGY